MGIASDWAKIFHSEGDSFVVQQPDASCKSIFIDAQIVLMRSCIKEDETWKDYVRRSFFSLITKHFATFDVVILSFDFYGSVPIFKSLTQTSRIDKCKSVFAFDDRQTLPPSPPDPGIWSQAIMNRDFKTKLISFITTMILSEYTPPRRGVTLLVDFVNVTKVTWKPITINYASRDPVRTVLTDMLPMGEGDVKFLRFIQLFGDLLVDSIDSDCLLIAAHYVVRHKYTKNLYIRRYKTRMPASVGSVGSVGDTLENMAVTGGGTAKAAKAGKRTLTEALEGAGGILKGPLEAPGGSRRAKLEYEIVHVNMLVEMLHLSMKQAVPRTVNTGDAVHLNAVLMFVVLLCGCDYSKKLPRIGVRGVWERLHILVPALLMSTSYNQQEVFVVDVDQTINTMVAGLYASAFSKHVDAQNAGDMSAVLLQLQHSKLAAKTKEDMPTHESLRTMILNIEWVINYWAIENGDPVCHTDGSNGFSMNTKNKLVWGGAPAALKAL